MPFSFLLPIVSPILALAAMGLSMIPSPAFPFEAGTKWIAISPPHRSEPERVLITYPAKADGDAYTLGANTLWTGAAARLNATPIAEKFPLVILSHGLGGNAAGLGWLSTELARNGFIVAAPNHIHSTSGDLLAVESFKIWERAQDVSALIDALTGDPDWTALIDPTRIGGIGFSLGGANMMLSAGARASVQAFADYCVEASSQDSACNWFQSGGVNFAAVDRDAFDGSYRDARLSAMVAVDPGLAMAYQPDSLAAISTPTLFVNLGEGDAIMPGVRSAELAGRIKGAGYATIPGAVHFSFLGICNAGGAELLKLNRDDPVCDDGGDIPRKELHRQILFKISTFLRRTLVER